MEENLSFKPRGRKLGSENKISYSVKKIIAEIVEENLSNLNNDLQQMKPIERAKIIISLLEHISPKLRSVEQIEVKENFTPIEVKINEN